MKPKVGDKVYVVPHRRNKDNFHAEVLRVGRKYFYIKEDTNVHWEIKVSISDWKEYTGGYTSMYSIYRNEQQYINKQRAKVIRGKIREVIDGSYGSVDIHLRDLEEIAHILDIDIVLED